MGQQLSDSEHYSPHRRAFQPHMASESSASLSVVPAGVAGGAVGALVGFGAGFLWAA